MNYGEFGGQYVPQELKEKLNSIKKEFDKLKKDKKFKKELRNYLKTFVGRCESLYFALGSDKLKEIGIHNTDERIFLRTVIITIAHKIYLDKYLQEMKKAQKK